MTKQFCATSGRPIVTFEGIGYCTYKSLGMRCPNKGEYYLSGAVPQAYLALNNLSREYTVVEPLGYADSRTIMYESGPLVRHAVSRRILSQAEIRAAARRRDRAAAPATPVKRQDKGDLL